LEIWEKQEDLKKNKSLIVGGSINSKKVKSPLLICSIAKQFVEKLKTYQPAEELLIQIPNAIILLHYKVNTQLSQKLYLYKGLQY